MSARRQHAIAADHLFDGAIVQRNAAIVLEDSDIVAIVPQADLPATMSLRKLPDGAWLAPGFIDLQVNGGGDVLFNDTPTAAGMRAIAAAHRRFGTTALLPTLISDTPDKMAAALTAVEESVDTDPGIIGIHLEGPFLSPERPGVHDLRHIRPPTSDDRAILATPRKGVTVVTLAPERVPTGFIRDLTNAGVRVCLGHSMATYAETRAAMAEGLGGFTHLFNAMRPLGARDPGPIAAALESPQAWFGMIVDGMHVDPAMLRLALRGDARPILVTDAMPPVGGTQVELRSVWRGNFCGCRTMRAQGWNARRRGTRHGHRGPQLRASCWRAVAERLALCIGASRTFSGTRSSAGPTCARLPRRPGSARSDRYRSIGNLGCRQ